MARYNEEFKLMIVKLYEDGKKVEELQREYEISDKTIYRWLEKYSIQPTRGNASKSKELASNADVEKLRLENLELKKELEVLKKCITIFSRK